MKKTIYKTVIQIEILSDEPIEAPETLTLDQIDYEITGGAWSGDRKVTTANKPLKGVKAADAVLNQGSSPDFFQMDEAGNEIKL